jgi:hypothetical protein
MGYVERRRSMGQFAARVDDDILSSSNEFHRAGLITDTRFDYQAKTGPVD